MKSSKTLALITAAGLLAVPLAGHAASNPFGISDLSTTGALQLTQGKCGAGKCGGEKKNAESKCGAGKCGGSKNTEGKCGAGKCGSSKAGDAKKDTTKEYKDYDY